MTESRRGATFLDSIYASGARFSTIALTGSVVPVPYRPAGRQASGFAQRSYRSPYQRNVTPSAGRVPLDRRGDLPPSSPRSRAPLYTNNKLNPVEGFQVPQDHEKDYDALDVSVRTDSRLTLTRAMKAHPFGLQLSFKERGP